MKSSNVTAGEDIRSHWNIVGNMKQDPEQKQAAIKSVVLLWAFLICCLFQNILRVGLFEHSYLLRVFFFKETDSHKEVKDWRQHKYLPAREVFLLTDGGKFLFFEDDLLVRDKICPKES